MALTLWFVYLCFHIFLSVSGMISSYQTGPISWFGWFLFLIDVPGFVLIALYALKKHFGPDNLWKVYAVLVIASAILEVYQIKFSMLDSSDWIALIGVYLLNLPFYIGVTLYAFKKSAAQPALQ